VYRCAIGPGGGGDIGPLRAGGVPCLGMQSDTQRYSDHHQSGDDTIDTVNPRELEPGASSMAILSIVLAEE
jgi:hypothetical protein